MKFLKNKIAHLAAIAFSILVFSSSCGIPESTRILDSPIGSYGSNFVSFQMPNTADISGYYVYYKFYDDTDLGKIVSEAYNNLNPNINTSLSPGNTQLLILQYMQSSNEYIGLNKFSIEHNPGSIFRIEYRPADPEKLYFLQDGTQAVWNDGGPPRDLKLLRSVTDNSNNYLSFRDYKYDDTSYIYSDSTCDADMKYVLDQNAISNIDKTIAIAFSVYAYNRADDLQAEYSYPVFIGYISQFNIGNSVNTR